MADPTPTVREERDQHVDHLPNFALSQTAPAPTIAPLDLSPLYAPQAPPLAILLDSVLTPEECASLLSTLPSNHFIPSTKNTASTFRQSSRILSVSPAFVSSFLSRISAHIPHVLTTSIVGKSNETWSRARGETGHWQLHSLNPMLRFLRYEPGQYFKPHCDGLYSDGERKSFLTVHLYLNDEGLEGGATRFYSEDRKRWVDVSPKAGRVLVFQQRLAWHSGEEVSKGVKYTMRTDVMFEKIVVGREQRKEMERRRREEEGRKAAEEGS